MPHDHTKPACLFLGIHLPVSAQSSTLDVATPSLGTPQLQFNDFYSFAVNLLSQFYPVRIITVTSRYPDFATPAMKAKLRRKNSLICRGRTEEASTLAHRIGKRKP